MSDRVGWLVERLVAFYRGSQRDLPWRHTRDPYAIWVSEIMLQQTQVDTVVPRYGRFLAEFPTLQALAATTETRVCEAWAGLGYYRRARHLHQAARLMVERHDGCLPQDVDALRALPGIGRYTAGAIASIAFGLPAPIVDGNVERVVARLEAVAGDVRRPPEVTRIWQFAAALVETAAKPGELNQALMELGALLCTPRAPRCHECPVRDECAAHGQGRAESFPNVAPATTRKRMRIAFAWIETTRGIWLTRRPLDGLWAGLWELPSAPAAKLLRERFGGNPRRITQVAHQLTHRDVVATIYRTTAAPPRRSATLQPFRDPLSAPLSGLARKAVQAVLSNGGQ